MKWVRVLPISIAFVATAFFAFAANSSSQLYPVQILTDQGKVSFKVELAQTFEEKQKGLMGRTYLARNRGMLFVYDSEQPVSFWMKNMLIPLDILFIGADHRIQEIAKVMLPCAANQPCIPYTPKAPAQYVLEIRSGLSDAKKIEVGDVLSVTF